MNTDLIMTNIQRNVHSALFDAKAAVRVLESSGEPRDIRTLRAETGASLIALRGLQSISVAESLYLAYSEQEGENEDLETIIHKYKVFVREVTTDTATDHSHQWSIIEFERLLDSARGTRYWSDGLEPDESEDS